MTNDLSDVLRDRVAVVSDTVLCKPVCITYCLDVGANPIIIGVAIAIGEVLRADHSTTS